MEIEKSYLILRKRQEGRNNLADLNEYILALDVLYVLGKIKYNEKL
ncbi:ABC-three component system middle component 7 [Coprobacillaceae bacterium CR2/5/TPMF4]|nr:ABC-three component system middle component 7 [Coprobacillaceae bacterium CR2/5/TPMF4]